MRHNNRKQKYENERKITVEKPVRNTFVKFRVLEKNQFEAFVEEYRLTHSVLLESSTLCKGLLCAPIRSCSLPFLILFESRLVVFSL